MCLRCLLRIVLTEQDDALWVSYDGIMLSDCGYLPKDC